MKINKLWQTSLITACLLVAFSSADAQLVHVPKYQPTSQCLQQT